MDSEIEKTVVFKLGEIIDYAPGQVVVKPIYKQSTGHISIICIDKGKSLDAIASAFNTFLYVIEGSTELFFDKIPRIMQTGEGVVVPAHKPHSMTSPDGCKLMLVVIKSGYD